MQIHLSPRHVSLSASIHTHAATIIAQLEDLADIIAAHLVLINEQGAATKKPFVVKAHLAVRGPDIHAEDRAETLHAALDLVADKLARQLRKRKTRLKDNRRTLAQRTKERAKRA